MAETIDRLNGLTTNQVKKMTYSSNEERSTLTFNDFMKLFVKELQNQDFTNPMDSGQMMDQITQLSNMQMMQSMANYSKSNYALTLIGKQVTASTVKATGATEIVSGIVDRVSLEGEDYVLYIGNKRFSMDSITEVCLPTENGLKTI